MTTTQARRKESNLPAGNQALSKPEMNNSLLDALNVKFCPQLTKKRYFICDICFAGMNIILTIRLAPKTIELHFFLFLWFEVDISFDWNFFSLFPLARRQNGVGFPPAHSNNNILVVKTVAPTKAIKEEMS